MNDQLTLIEAESDEALLLPDLERRKRYTAAQVEKIEWKLDMILLAIAAQVIPLQTIAERAHVNFRVVQELATRYAERIGQDAVKLADYAAAKSAKFLFLADRKSENATFKDLMIGHGIARDTVLNMRLSAAGQTDLNDAIDVVAEDEELKRFREGLRQLKSINTEEVKS